VRHLNDNERLEMFRGHLAVRYATWGILVPAVCRPCFHINFESRTLLSPL